jgi:uncharacterized protein HemY
MMLLLYIALVGLVAAKPMIETSQGNVVIETSQGNVVITYVMLIHALVYSFPAKMESQTTTV